MRILTRAWRIGDKSCKRWLDFGRVDDKVAQCAAANPHPSRKGMDNFAMQKRLPFAPEHDQPSSHAATTAGRPAARPGPTRLA